MTNLNNKTYTYELQYQPYITWKGNNYKASLPINARPETNGSWILNKEGYDKDRKDGNAFLARPLKHWRKQLKSDTIRGGTKNVNIYDINSPGLYNILKSKSCCDLSNNSFVIVSDIQNKNNTTIYDNSEYKISYNDISNCWNGPPGKRICCNPENNLIRYETFSIKNNYITYSNYFQHKCYQYNQNISTTKINGNTYINSNGLICYPTNSSKGCQVLQKSDCSNDCCRCNNNGNNNKGYTPISNRVQTMIYKPKNYQYSKQGATSNKSRIYRLTENTINIGNSLYNNANGLKQINNGICNINGDSIYYIKTKPEYCI